MDKSGCNRKSFVDMEIDRSLLVAIGNLVDNLVVLGSSEVAGNLVDSPVEPGSFEVADNLVDNLVVFGSSEVAGKLEGNLAIFSMSDPVVRGCFEVVRNLDNIQEAEVVMVVYNLEDILTPASVGVALHKLEDIPVTVFDSFEVVDNLEDIPN